MGKSLIKKIAQESLETVAEDMIPELKEAALKEAHTQYDRGIKAQIFRKREKISCEEEEKMLKNAFEKGVVRIPTTDLLIWSEADKIAKELAGGLCTKEELENAGLRTIDEVDLWVYALHTDGSADVINLGNNRRERYTSHKDKVGAISWLEVKKHQFEEKQLDHIFAKRCETKNPNYVPMDFTKNNEIHAKAKPEIMKTASERFDKSLKRQIDKKRQKMTCEQEEQILKNAFEKGIVRIPTSEILIWSKANEIANELAGGLCTREEFINAGLKTVDGVDFWAYALHTDGGPDVIQFGTRPHERYISHRDKHGAARWLEKIEEQNEWRQMDHIFAKRCEQKNPTYIPTDFSKEKEFLVQYEADLIQESQKKRDIFLKSQIYDKREKMTCEEEEQMLKNAFEKGIVRIQIAELMIWSKADEIAKELAGGLCTREELINAGIKSPDGVSFWAFALHT